MEKVIGCMCKLCACTCPGDPGTMGIDPMAFTRHDMVLEVPLNRCVVQGASLKLKRSPTQSTSILFRFTLTLCMECMECGGVVVWCCGVVVRSSMVWYGVVWSGREWCGGVVEWCGGVVVWRGGVALWWRGGVVLWWCGVVTQWCGGVGVSWCGGGAVVWWCGVMVSWCGGAVARWCGGVGVSWCGGVVLTRWCGGVGVSWCCGGVASLRLKNASLDQQRCQLFPTLQ